jgi:hypothetical protein
VYLPFFFLMMKRPRFWLLLAAFLLILFVYALVSWSQAALTAQETDGAAPNNNVTTSETAPEMVFVTDEGGQVLSSHSGPLWILVSGIDEHGLPETVEITLLADPHPEAAFVHTIATGTPVAVHEIRQTGPQNLWRFYLVRTVDGQSGWVSDYFIRRLAYLFEPDSDMIPLYHAPGGRQIIFARPVTAVILKDPTRDDWWQVQTITDEVTAWVEARHVYESPEWEFLFGLEGQGHTHGQRNAP